MTPKEKAKELVDKFINIDSDSEMFDGFKMPLFYAQRCSLIAVDEIIKFGNQAGIREPMMYWNKVKEEIENL